MISVDSRERCWVTHKRRAYWNQCPLCGQPIRWIRLWFREYSPCDIEPVLYSFPGGKTKFRVVSKSDVIDNVVFQSKPGEKPRYGWRPHYYTCPVLIQERLDWAKMNYLEGIKNDSVKSYRG